ncbi:MAG: MFS transporter, partial [Candidatus Eremiobacteraeota bacterium]|nr:MFS transporter [Candidatus Eremiobacteraeota bacterium]
GPYLSELFPNDVRGAAQGFCYNTGRGIAGFAPFIVGYLAVGHPIGNAMMTVAIMAYSVAIISVSLLPETNGIRFQAEPALELHAV